jgi:hypothetical protein
MRQQVVRIRVSNSSLSARSLHLEPWGEVFEIPASGEFEVSARGPDINDTLEVEIGSEGITIHGWPGSVVNVIDHGTALGVELWQRPPVPDVPH